MRVGEKEESACHGASHGNQMENGARSQAATHCVVESESCRERRGKPVRSLDAAERDGGTALQLRDAHFSRRPV